MLTNNPIGKDSVLHPWVRWDGGFSDEELQKIIKYCEAQELQKAAIEHNLKDQMRVSAVNFHRLTAETDWIFQKLNSLTDFVNNSFFGFHLSGYEVFQFSTYDGEESGRYDLHVDCVFGEVDRHNGGLHRKLSMSLLLNDDFEGGEFEIQLGKPMKIDIPKGKAVFFPSFVPHRVLPVTKGIRKSLVLWVLGKKFV